MTQAEKLAMVHGYSGSYIGNVQGNSRLNIPPINLQDGPQGVADGATQVTCWPSAMTVAMTWDVESMFSFGQAMGAEQYIKGGNVMLGPGVNLARVPWGGRNWEYLGEDPVLAARMVFAEVQGIQINNISGCIKHFVNNNQEYNRTGVSVIVAEKEQVELYLVPFAAAVNAGVGSAMCSYNLVNGTWACENSATLSALKHTYGFDGWVMSDWGATHSTVAAALAGLDQQMPDDSFFGPALAAAIQNGEVAESRLDDMVTRILVPMFALGLFENPPTGNPNANANSAAHNDLALTLAENAATLLKNDGNILPLQATALRSIAVFGDTTTVHCFGSGGVNPPYVITPFEGVMNVVNPNQPPRPANCTYIQNYDYYQPNANPCVFAVDLQTCCATCSNTSGCNYFTYVAGASCSGGANGACWLKPTNEGGRTFPGGVAGACAPLPPGSVNVTYNSGTDPIAAAALAAAVDIAIVVVATSSSEGVDRVNLSLPFWHDELVEAVAAVQRQTIVVVNCPGACVMPWASKVPAILYQGMPGQEAGNSMAKVLFGLVNPSGKLPLSFPNTMEDTWLGNPVNPVQYPGVFVDGLLTVNYTEGSNFGYRWYDAQGTQPLWPFGHGLSYSTFDFSDIEVSGYVSPSVNVTITFLLSIDAGGINGTEVVQLYVGYPDIASQPPKLLKDFVKVAIAAGAAPVVVSFTLSAADLSVWNVDAGVWTLVPGAYSAQVGSSSRDIRLVGAFLVSASD